MFVTNRIKAFNLSLARLRPFLQPLRHSSNSMHVISVLSTSNLFNLLKIKNYKQKEAFQNY